MKHGTKVTAYNYKATEKDDAAHISYLKRDINYDAKHGHSDANMTADEKHISKLAGDMRYDKKHHGAPTSMCSPNHYDSPAKQVGFGMANNAMALASKQMIQPMTNVPPAGSSLVNPFSPQAQANAQGVFGTTPMMQNAVGAPAMFKDQTGDGQITQADVIKARVEGYKK